MKVWVNSPFIHGLKGEMVKLEGEAPTLKELLKKVSQILEEDGTLLDSMNENLRSMFAVRLNGELHRFLQDGLDTRLQDGDRIEITLSALGGG